MADLGAEPARQQGLAVRVTSPCGRAFPLLSCTLRIAHSEWLMRSRQSTRPHAWSCGECRCVIAHVSTFCGRETEPPALSVLVLRERLVRGRRVQGVKCIYKNSLRILFRESWPPLCLLSVRRLVIHRKLILRCYCSRVTPLARTRGSADPRRLPAGCMCTNACSASVRPARLYGSDPWNLQRRMNGKRMREQGFAKIANRPRRTSGRQARVALT